MVQSYIFPFFSSTALCMWKKNRIVDMSLLHSIASNLYGYQFISGLVEDFLIQTLKTGPIPEHVSFVLDGNRRYAKSQGLALKDGHTAGAETLGHVLRCCFKIGVKAITVYAFSIENFNRPQSEIDTLFDLLKSRLIYLTEENGFSVTHGLKIQIIGNRTMIPPQLLLDLEEIERKTVDNKDHTLYIAFPYTSRDDITHSITTIVDKINRSELKSSDVTESTIEDNFYWGEGVPKVDILVRTSGHTRLSDYMLWQCHQESVIEYVNTLWPDFKFFDTWWILFKWSYFKNLIIKDAEVMQLKRVDKQTTDRHYGQLINNHPPFASVNKTN